MRPLLRALLPLALLLAAPVASAAQTLASLEEPVVAGGGAAPTVVDLVVTPEEAARSHYVVFSTQPNRGMQAELVASNGTTVWEEPRATNGVRPFAPRLEPGAYKLVLRGTGQLQVTHRVLASAAAAADEAPRETNGTLDGTHAYLFQSPLAWRVSFEGDVNVTWDLLAGPDERFDAPGNVTTTPQHVYVATLRGEPGAAYVVRMERAPDADPTGRDGDADTPAPWLALTLAALALAALRRTRG